MKTIIKSTLGLITVITFTACSEVSIEGKWTEPVPGMSDQTQGFMLENGGKASSINMATLQYNQWKREGNTLILSGESIGNGQTISFNDTLEIQELTNEKLVLKRNNGNTISYQKQK